MAPPNTTFVSRYAVNSSIIGANTNGNTTPAAARFPDVAHRISQPSSTTTTAKKARVANKSISFLAPHKLQQEFKCLAAMVAYSIVCEKHAGMKVNAIDEAVKEYCHGVKQKDIIALFSLMLKGDAPFSDLWVKSTDSSGQEELVLNPQLYPSPRYTAGVSFTQLSLRAKSKDTGIIATGRALVSMAKKGIANNKKALAFTKAFLDQNGNLPSGTNEDDLYAFVNNKMYIGCTKKASCTNNAINVDMHQDDESSVDGDETQLNNAESPTQPSIIQATFDEDDFSVTNEEQAPEGFFFTGFFAFVLFGPFGDKENESVLLGIDGEKKNKGGRASLRIDEAEAANKERERAPGRGVPIGGTKLHAAMLAQAEGEQQQRCEDRELFAIKEQIACINKQFDNAKMLIESDWYPEEEKMELKRSIRFLMTSLKDKQEELNCLGKRPRVVSAAVTSFINHTGIIDLCDD